jgi:hypothetical protein
MEIFAYIKCFGFVLFVVYSLKYCLIFCLCGTLIIWQATLEVSEYELAGELVSEEGLGWPALHMLSPETYNGRNQQLVGWSPSILFYISSSLHSVLLLNLNLHTGVFFVIFQVRFLLRGGRESEAQEKEVVGYGNGLMSSLLGLTIRYGIYMWKKITSLFSFFFLRINHTFRS